MRKEKIWYYVAAGLCVLGLLLCLGPLIANGFSLERMDPDSVYSEQHYAVQAEGIDAVALETHNFRVEVKPTDSDEIRLTYYESRKVTYTITEQDGVLRIAEQNHMQWYDYFANGLFGGLSAWNKAVTLELPAGLACDLELSSSNGDVSMQDLQALGRVKLSTSNGAVTIRDLSCSALEAFTSNGAITAERVTTAGDGQLQTSNGRLWVSAATAGGKFSAGTSNGEIAFEKLHGSELILSTSNGAIYGSIDGNKTDYTIRSSTSNGGNNLGNQESTGGKTLDVSTTNGNIDISFNEN